MWHKQTNGENGLGKSGWRGKCWWLVGVLENGERASESRFCNRLWPGSFLIENGVAKFNLKTFTARPAECRLTHNDIDNDLPDL